MIKMLICGLGGVGSMFSKGIYELIEKGQLDVDVTIIDNDIVEMNQIKYQNFTVEDIGKSKAEVLGKRYDFKFIIDRVLDDKYLKGYDLIVLCVDNNKCRKIVFDSGFEFIDLRATGRTMFAMSPGYPKFIDKDVNEYSCQKKADLDKGWIQMGSQIIALIGCQMILNFSRGLNNRAISLFV